MSDEANSAPRKRTWQAASGGSPAVTGTPRAPLRPSPRKTKAYLVLATILALVGVAIAFILWFGSFDPPYYLNIAVVETRSWHYPPNPWAEQDARAVLRHFELADPGLQNQEGHLLIADLDALKSRREGKVVVYLCALAVCRGQQVYLIPGDAEEVRPDSWKTLPLAGVLDRLEACPARHKLLILDLFRPTASRRLGIVDDDVAEAVHAMLRRRLEEKKLTSFVLLACARGQRSQMMRTTGRSAFAYYLDEGLCGRADHYNPQQHVNGRVSVLELAAFVKERVERWSAETMRARQTPVLLGDFPDFDLTHASDRTPLTADAAPYPDWLDASWRERDRWLEPGGLTINWSGRWSWDAPSAFQRWEALLLRAEQLRAAGRPIDSLQPEIAQAAQTFHRQSESASLPLPGWHSARGAAVQRGFEVPADAKRAARQLLMLLERNPPPADDEAKKAREDFARSVAAAETQGMPKNLARVLAVWETLLESDPVPEAAWHQRLRRCRELLDADAAELRYLETALLHLLGGLTIKKPEHWARALHGLLKATDAAERLAARERRSLALFRDALEAADTERRAAWQRILTGTAADRPDEEIIRLIDSALNRFDRLSREFSDARSRPESGDAVHAAYVLHNRAVRLLPCYADFLDDRIDASLDQWLDAKSLVQALGRRLYPDTGRPADETRSIAELCDALRSRLEQLHQPLRKQLERLDQRDMGLIEAALATPLPTAAERSRWRRQIENQARELEARILERDAAENANRHRRPISSSGGLSGPASSLLAARRARLAVELLDLAEDPDLGKARAALSAADWDALGDELRAGFGPRLAERINLADDDRTKHLLATYVSPWDQALMRENVNFAARCRRQLETTGYRWLADRLEADARLLNDPAWATWATWLRHWSGTYGDLARRSN